MLLSRLTKALKNAVLLVSSVSHYKLGEILSRRLKNFFENKSGPLGGIFNEPFCKPLEVIVLVLQKEHEINNTPRKSMEQKCFKKVGKQSKQTSKFHLQVNFYDMFLPVVCSIQRQIRLKIGCTLWETWNTSNAHCLVYAQYQSPW